jgi:hypothetical protein
MADARKQRDELTPADLEQLEMPAYRGPDRRRVKGESPTGVERRRGPGRRLSDFLKAAEDGELTKEQFLFVMAIDAFKRANNVMYPNWTDVLEVVRLLGYRKTLASELDIPSAEDWREPPNAPADVRTDRQKQRDAQARGKAA